MTVPPPSAAAPRVGLDYTIETPENVILTYQLAGPAIRLAAYLIDLVPRVGVLFLATILMCGGLAILPGLSMGLLLLVMFLNEWGYFALLEWLFNGKTLGKHALGLRVIHSQGHPITFWSALLRNFLRAADVLPFLYGGGFLAMAVSRKFQRLGDLAAGTIVIQERRVSLPREAVILEKIQPIPREDINRHVPDEQTLSLIDQFLGRRQYLARRQLITHERGHQLAFRLARVLAERLEYGGDFQFVENYPMAFLARVYVTYIHRPDDEDGDRSSHPPHREPARHEAEAAR